MACDGSLTNGDDGTCAAVPDNTDPEQECGDAGGVCVAGACSNGANNGVACVQNNQCRSNWCVDGVCCESNCGGTCEACSTGSSGAPDGTCAAIPLFGDPAGECLSAGGGACNGAGGCKTASKVTASDAQSGDGHGRAVAISGDYAIVGASYEDGSIGEELDRGAAYVYHRTAIDTWEQGIKLVALDAQTADRFGCSVAIHGDYAIVGACDEDGPSADKFDDRGAAYIYHRTGADSWDDVSKLYAPYAQAGDHFGVSVSISGDYAIVGASGEDGGNGDPIRGAGAAYIYCRTGVDAWDRGTKVVAPDAQVGDGFGVSVAISGDYAIVGAHGEDGGSGDPLTYAGAAYVFGRTGANTWDSGTKLVALDAQSSDLFGASVAISGDYAIVGAEHDDGGSGDPLRGAGAAYVFYRTGGNAWDSGTKLVAPDTQADDFFGFSVAISGDHAIVGAMGEDGGGGDPLRSAGAAYVFHRTGANAWDSGTKLVAPDAQADDKFGISVAISGDYAIVGAHSEDGGSGNPYPGAGAAYIY